MIYMQCPYRVVRSVPPMATRGLLYDLLTGAFESLQAYLATAGKTK